jgi:signal transduction histidine kinase
MEERAALVGGQYRIVSVPSKGTRVEVVVPQHSASIASS